MNHVKRLAIRTIVTLVLCSIRLLAIHAPLQLTILEHRWAGAIWSALTVHLSVILSTAVVARMCALLKCCLTGDPAEYRRQLYDGAVQAPPIWNNRSTHRYAKAQRHRRTDQTHAQKYANPASARSHVTRIWRGLLSWLLEIMWKSVVRAQTVN